MDYICFLCKNMNEFTSYVKYFDETYEEVKKRSLLNEANSCSYVHLKCSCFHPELDLAIYRNPLRHVLEIENYKDYLSEPLVVNGKYLYHNQNADCSMCEYSIAQAALVQCAYSGCHSLFHLQCINHRTDVKRIKMAKKDNTTFKYGFFCSLHHDITNDTTDVLLKFKEFELFEIMNPALFEQDLNLFESLFSQNDRIQKESMEVDRIVKECHKEIIEKKKLETKVEEESVATTPVTKVSSARKNSKTEETNKPEVKKRAQPRTNLARANNQKSRIRSKNSRPAVESKKKKPGKTEEPTEPPKENVASFISSRSKKDPESLNYNLRGEIKQNSKLEFDKKIYETNNPKRNRDKSTTEAPRTAEEKKRQFWIDINDNHFRKPHQDEMDALKVTHLPAMLDILRNESQRVYNSPPQEVLETFVPTFESSELKTYQKDALPNFDNKDCVKVIFESREALKSKSYMMCYFRMKKKAQNELPIPESTEFHSTMTDEKYFFIPSHQVKDLKNEMQESLKIINNKNKSKYFDELIDDEELSNEGFYKLFGLKHVDFISKEDVLESKARIMFQADMEELKESYNIPEPDQITKEILFLDYLLYQFSIPESNARKERMILRMREEDHNYNSLIKLQDKVKKLDSELKFDVIKKYFKLGLNDKTQNSVIMLYQKPETDTTQTFGPPADPRNQSYLKKAYNIEIDCTICFHNQSNDNNPIIYCSGCDISFHQYCYGIFELPTSDFYCDICVHTNTKKKTASSKHRRHIPKEKPAERKVPNDIFCKVCLQNDFPLKRMKKNEWYHITCLMFHDIIYHKGGEYLIKQEKNHLLINLNYETPVTECTLCQKKGGLFIKCAEPDCPVQFHGLCGYLEGFEVGLTASNEYKDDKTKNGFICSIYCADHAQNKERDHKMQKYFRRFTTNYRNTVDFPNYELYTKYLENPELYIQTQNPPQPETGLDIEPVTEPVIVTNTNPEEVSQETSDTNKKHESIFQDPEELIVNAKRAALDQPEEIDESVSALPEKKVKSE